LDIPDILRFAGLAFGLGMMRCQHHHFDIAIDIDGERVPETARNPLSVTANNATSLWKNCISNFSHRKMSLKGNLG